MKKTRLRRLGFLEKAAAYSAGRFPFNAIGVVRLGSRISLEHLRIAARVVQRRHPLLTAQISKQGSTYWFEQGPCHELPVHLVERNASDAWIQTTEDCLNRRLSGCPLLNCTLVRNAGSGDDLIVWAHHAIIDFESGTNFINELLDTYDVVTSGRSPVVDKRYALPPAAEELFPRAYRGLRRLPSLASFVARQLGEELRFAARSKGELIPETQPEAKCRLSPLQLSAAETTALIRQVRKSKLTVNAVLIAAMLLVVNRELAGGEPRYTRYITFANLRPRREANESTLSSYFSMLRFAAWVSPGSDLGSLAVTVTAQIHSASRRGDRFCALLLCPLMIKIALSRPARRMATVALSWSGHTELRQKGDTTRVVDFHSCVSNIPMGPPCTAQARIFNGKLTVDFVFLEPETDPVLAARILDHFKQALIEWMHV